MTKRVKWFVPSDDEQSFKPFGIECRDAVTLGAQADRSALSGHSDDASPPMDTDEIARTFWVGHGGSFPELGLRQGSR
ncbi:hypothetical protein [Verrucosispora sp. NA02020]|uniref:hypothetical protein n=1 Tax=Verrucosispora sp. NA02020 TaxID=2742132 RepID=UPI003D736FEA